MVKRQFSRKRFISIHALHEESDLMSAFALSSSAYFNPRSP